MNEFEKNDDGGENKVLAGIPGKSHKGTRQTARDDIKLEELSLARLNMNDRVYFEVTQGTIDTYKDDPEGLTNLINYSVSDYIVDGKTVRLARMQLWEFISKFGKNIYMTARPVIKDNTLYFVPEEDANPEPAKEQPVETAKEPGKENSTKATFTCPWSSYNLGGQVWMGENLKIDDGGKGIYCNEYTGEIYYTFEAAKRVTSAIPGWHVPTREEWEELCKFAGGQLTMQTGDSLRHYTLCADKLKSKDWRGHDTFGLAIKPCGRFTNINAQFEGYGDSAYFWTATESELGKAFIRSISGDSCVLELSAYTSRGYSVRLVKDADNQQT